MAEEADKVTSGNLTGDDNVSFSRRLLLSAAIPFTFVMFMWLVHITTVVTGIEAWSAGVYPLSIRGLPGIVLSPFIHSSFGHLWNNSLPILFLGTALFLLYGDVAIKVFLFNHLLSGVLLWIAGRESWHIGASGVVYGLAFFLFFSGVIRRHFRLMALSLVVVFLYGSMVWGMFPIVPANISWESHMLGAFSGIFLAVAYRHRGPQKPAYPWLDEEDDDDEEADTDYPGEVSSDSNTRQEADQKL